MVNDQKTKATPVSVIFAGHLSIPRFVFVQEPHSIGLGLYRHDVYEAEISWDRPAERALDAL